MTDETKGSPRRLLTETDFRAALGGVGERTFKDLRARGVIPAALALAPRIARWTQDDVAAVIARLPRRERAPEPQTLAEGRRARIERMKASGEAA